MVGLPVERESGNKDRIRKAVGRPKRLGLDFSFFVPERKDPNGIGTIVASPTTARPIALVGPRALSLGQRDRQECRMVR